jgi:4-oxalmesaconate hydratase
MIIDVHGHNLNPRGFGGGYTDRGAHGKPTYRFSDDELAEPLNTPTFRAGSLIEQVREVGTDMQLLSPRPISMAHHEKPAKVVHWHIEEQNNIIAAQAKLFSDMFRGMAGLPQSPDESPKECLEELERAVKELGMVGCLLNPDPGEGWAPPPPGLGDEYWYPLYEKLVELDVPAMIHPTQFIGREPYTLHFMNEESVAVISLLESRVFLDFPNLKIVVSHGGGCIPFHVGRFKAFYDRPGRRPLDELFEQSLRRLYFDTALYTKEAVELLIRVVGPDNCLFGTERPGTGTAKDPDTGKWMDDVLPYIEGIEWLSKEDKRKVLEGNAKKIYRLGVESEASETTASGVQR